MTKILFDSDSLIKITKAGLKELIVDNFKVIIPLEIKKECVEQSQTRPDGVIINKNIENGKIEVKQTKRSQKTENDIQRLDLRGGEQDVYRLNTQIKYDLISSDDKKFLNILHFLGAKAVTPATLLILLNKRNKLNKIQTIGYLEKLKEHISYQEYELCKVEIGG